VHVAIDDVGEDFDVGRGVFGGGGCRVCGTRSRGSRSGRGWVEATDGS
jgi:hypothetical protein